MKLQAVCERCHARFAVESGTETVLCSQCGNRVTISQASGGAAPAAPVPNPTPHSAGSASPPPATALVNPQPPPPLVLPSTTDAESTEFALAMEGFTPQPAGQGGPPRRPFELIGNEFRLEPPSAPPAPFVHADASSAEVGLPAAAPLSRGAPADKPAAGEPGEYAFAEIPRAGLTVARRRTAKDTISNFYHALLRELELLLQGIDVVSYRISLVCLLPIVLGAIFGNHSVVAAGVTIVVLLNIVRCAGGLISLVVMPFRRSLLAGILFLIPPITFVSLCRNWRNMRKPLGRIANAVLTLCIVVLSYAFVQSRDSTSVAGGGLGDRLGAAVRAVHGDIAATLHAAANVHLDAGIAAAERAINHAEDRVRSALGWLSPAPTERKPPARPNRTRRQQIDIR